MSNLNLFCLTCLSTAEDGATIPQSIREFLCETLNFKCMLKESISPKVVCRKCYKTLVDLRRFYAQLRDVEMYFEHKLTTTTVQGSKRSNDNDVIEVVDEIETLVPAFNDATQDTDPILVEEQEQQPKKKAKKIIKIAPEASSNVVTAVNIAPSMTPKPNLVDHAEQVRKLARVVANIPAKVTGRRFVCLICSSLFSSIEELRTHESTHSAAPTCQTQPIFVPTATQPQESFGCRECGSCFDSVKELGVHKRKHWLDKKKPFACSRCSRRFTKNDQLRDHELIHSNQEMCQCKICNKKYLNQSSLDAHMRVAHNITEDKETADSTVEESAPAIVELSELNELLEV